MMEGCPINPLFLDWPNINLMVDLISSNSGGKLGLQIELGQNLSDLTDFYLNVANIK